MGKKRAPADGATGAEHATIAEPIAAAAATIRREGMMARTALTRLGIPKKRIDDALEVLARDGFEVTTKAVRLPVRDQLRARLGDGSSLQLKTIDKAVCGATKREVADAAAELIAEGAARYVVRTTEVVLVGERAAVLDDVDLDTLQRTLDVLSKTMKLARKKKATLLRADVAHALSRFAPRPPAPPVETTKTTTGASERAPGTSNGDLASLVERHREKTGLTFVPTLVRVLGGEGARETVHAELLRGARAGIFELRPESGLGRLSPEDVSFCIPGPQGSRLSWVRRMDS